MLSAMKTFIDELTGRGYQNRKLGFVENGTWGPTAAKIMKGAFEKSKDISYADTVVTIKSAMTDVNKDQLKALAEEMK